MGANYGTKTIAQMFGISDRRVRQLVEMGVLTQTARGRFELIPTVKAFCDYLRERIDNPGDGDENHKERLIKARADLAEMEADRVKGETVDVEAVTQAWVDATSRFRAKMLALPHKAAPLVAVEDDADACHHLIEAQVHEALEELAGAEVDVAEAADPGDAGSSAGGETAAAPVN